MPATQLLIANFPPTSYDKVGSELLECIARANAVLFGLTREALWLPFDGLRTQYAAAVKHGLVERSLLASARFEQQVGLLEKLALGAAARSV